MLYLIFQIVPGCDCCEVNGILVEDGTTWKENGKVYGKLIH